MANRSYKSTINVDNKEVYSLEDLFNLPEDQIKFNIYEVINPTSISQNQDKFKYVQIHRQEIKTRLSKHLAVQMIDVSQKILYEMANGEKRLFSLINATVSHEMRNPANSIQAQVQEQKVLNEKLKDTVNTIKEEGLDQEKIQRSLTQILDR